MKRRRTPSNATVAGGIGGAVLAPAIITGLRTAGIDVTAELAASLAPALAFLFAYFTPGGRKGEGA